MDSSKFMRIACDLREQRILMAQIENDQSLYMRERSAAELRLTPDSGWPGKNTEERKLAQERTFASDPDLCMIDEKLSIVDQKIATATAAIAYLEDERRALEWQVRSILAERLPARDDKRQDDFDIATDAYLTELPY